MRILAVAAGVAMFAAVPVLAEEGTADEAAEAARADDPVSDDAMSAMYRSWLTPETPFRVAGNLYFVGTKGLSMFLITTDKGHILIDGGLPQNAPMVLESIRTLGFDPADVKILLNTHAHFDHSGGLAELKQVTGAELYASQGDRSALEGGFYLGSEDDTDLNAPPVAVDRLLQDGDEVTLGGVTLTARMTPGHSRGCTSWTFALEEGGAHHEVLIFGSASVAANRLVGPPQYEGIVEDYRETFNVARDWRPDIFLSNHQMFYGYEEKRAKLAAGDPLAFVDQTDFPKFIQYMELSFEKALAKAKAKQPD